MAKRRLVYLLGLLGSFVFYVAYQQWFSWILLLFMVLIPWLSLGISLGPIFRTSMEPAAAPRMPMGSPQTIELKVSSPYPLPPHRSKIRITNPMTGKRSILKPGDTLPTQHCGGIRAQLYRPRICDYLGLFGIPARKTAEQTFLVLPDPVRMEIPPDLSKYLAHRWRPKPGGGYAENHEIRQYHPGDNLNQIHWKLSAKVGGLMLREPMEPERGRMLLTMDLSGTASELDLKMGHLLWLGRWLLEQAVHYDVRVLTGNGIESRSIRDEWSLNSCIESLLCAPLAAEGTIRDRSFTADWLHHIGGEQNES